jgi:hypothetical protein
MAIMQKVKILTKMDLLSLLFQQERNKISLRAQNILEDIDILNFSSACNYYIIYQGKIDFRYVRNVGVKTNAELKSLFHKLEESFCLHNEIAKEYRERNKSLAEDPETSEMKTGYVKLKDGTIA